MNELGAVLDGIDELWRLGERPALATVVRVRGSAYRKPGARMLVAVGGGRRVGSVSGGCLEGDVARRAMELTAGGGAAVLRYDSTAEDDGLWGLGLGCNGVIEILVERLDAGDPLAGFLRGCQARRERGLVATVFGADGGSGVPIGARLLMDGGGRIASDPAGLAARVDGLPGDARDCLASGRTVTASYESGAGGRIEVLLEVVEPPTAVVIFGAGWDAGPVAAAAKAVGWHVTVVDRRARLATRERFPGADEVIACPADEAGGRVRLDARTAAVVMTHHYPDDLEYLAAAVRSEAAYVGLLGPARRRDRLLADLRERGGFVPMAAAQLGRLHGPVGLDVGAESPAEIAVSVVAGIMAAMRGREGGALRDRAAGIHDAVPEIGHSGAPAIASGAADFR